MASGFDVNKEWMSLSIASSISLIVGYTSANNPCVFAQCELRQDAASIASCENADKSYFSFYSRSNNKWTNANYQFT
jgi:hypothetical protein